MGWSSPPVIQAGTVTAEISGTVDVDVTGGTVNVGTIAGNVTIDGGPITVENNPGSQIATSTLTSVVVSNFVPNASFQVELTFGSSAITSAEGSGTINGYPSGYGGSSFHGMTVQFNGTAGDSVTFTYNSFSQSVVIPTTGSFTFFCPFSLGTLQIQAGHTFTIFITLDQEASTPGSVLGGVQEGIVIPEAPANPASLLSRTGPVGITASMAQFFGPTSTQIYVSALIVTLNVTAVSTAGAIEILNGGGQILWAWDINAAAQFSLAIPFPHKWQNASNASGAFEITTPSTISVTGQIFAAVVYSLVP